MLLFDLIAERKIAEAIGELERIIESLGEGEMRSAASRKLQLFRERIERSGLAGGGLRTGQPYVERVLQRLAR